ncbi:MULTISPECIES: transglutaminase family protein [unclassified Gordonia (in: high G+C Gram-positive bacteria)]|uniref:transglutaminase family protein n=1 Tax=unclassified Gordonia (in: high G+C Gram-positive bacteria) TaxID=2657482 RepID=UPI001F115B9A|nr:transglutaminase family protein [Gordonia sp. ABSL49_1]MCH5643548.1 transglutaminase family protein [Gordonia sp. ABSL49_1]
MTAPRRYRVLHRTCYTYDDEVSSSYGRCYLTPRELPHQRVHTSSVKIDPEPDDRSTGVDVYGNNDTYFHVRSPHRALEVTAESLVDVDPVDPQLLLSDAARGPWEAARPERGLAAEFVLDLDPPEISPAVVAYAASVFTPGRPLIEAITDLTTRIFTDFTYRSGSTAISTKVDTVMARREGVCQDFARVAIACLRSVGLAARYESGYLATDPPPGRERIFGADASHAWAAVWLPGDRWIAFDPTNDKLVDERHVTLAWGRDYDDVPPLRGVIYTESKKSRIDVSVDVSPLSQDDPAGVVELGESR